MPDVTGRLTTALADRYRLERELGAGGMATVYLAHDVKHDRNVALKVLRPELAAVIGAERFLNEIKVTANLQHPHILALHDSGEADGFLYYVMPYVEGESLRSRLNREKQLGIQETIEIAKAVASALDYAHERQVIHRDIKPENILIHAGQPVVADFGIALAVSAAGGARLTETGLSLGTPHYMSPEQAMGDRELDARSDVYSLACVVYEMLAGEPPYTGATAQAIVARVITEEPRRLTQQRRTVPRHVEAAVHRALHKLPADRFETAGRFIEALTNPALTTEAVGASMLGVAARRGVPRWIAGVLGGLAAAFGTLALWGWLRPMPKPVIRVGLALPADEALEPAATIRLAISSDGSRIVYTGPGGAGHRLWVRELNVLSGRPLAGTEGAQAPSFSPDGRSIVFFGGSGNLRVISIDGGPARTVVPEAVSPWGTDWGRDGMLYFSGENGGLHRVPESGGAVEVLSRVDSSRGAIEHDWPQVLPGGRAALVAVWSGSIQDVSISAVIFETGEVRPLTPGVYARFLPPDKLVAVTSDGTLMVAPFDVEQLELRGTPTAVLEGVRIDGTSASAQFAVSETGTLLYQGGDAQVEQPVWVTRDGSEQPIDSAWRASFNSLAVSPDGRRLAVSITDQNGEHIWVKQLDQGPLTRLTFEGSQNSRPAWSVDGQSVMFVSNRAAGDRQIWVKRADGSAPDALLIDDGQLVDEVAPVPGERWVLYRRGSGGVNTRDIAAIRPGVDTTARSVVASRYDDFAPTVSPNGRWLAYVSNESGRQEVYVRPFPETESARWQISVDGGTEPRWAPGGHELYYRTPRGDVMVVAVTSGSSFTYGTPQPLFRGAQYDADVYHLAWDVHPDGRRFVMVRREGVEQAQLVLVQNWSGELGDAGGK